MDISDKLKKYVRTVFGAQGDMRNTGIVFLVVIAFGIFIADKYTTSKESFALILLWILASLVSGAGTGFLFGIPKIIQNNSKVDQSVEIYRQQVNSNLTEISDWLTKIIVGLTLINLNKFPPYFFSVANLLATGLKEISASSALPFAYGIITCYSITGFLFGYIITRLFLSVAFSKADQEALLKLQKNLESTSAQIDVLESTQSFISQSILSKTNSTENIGNSQPMELQTALDELKQKANDYLKINNPNWGERVRLKDIAANEMGDFVLKNNISKTDLKEFAKQTSNEAIVLALAVVINIKPENGDFDKLLQVADLVSRLHIKHKVVVAISKLFKLRLVDQKDKKIAIDLLDKTYRNNADVPLLKVIDSTIALINSVYPG